MPIRTFRIGSPRSPSEGLRLGTVRYLPRGVKKADYARLGFFDVWLPQLAPSRELLKWAQRRPETPAADRAFFRRYRREIEGDTDARQLLLLLKAIARHTPLAVGCYCADEARCHRSALLEMLNGG
jgi:uncharacterized protein YeaO (DUF488 family)